MLLETAAPNSGVSISNLRHAVLYLVLHLVEPFVFFAVAGLGGFNVIPANVGGGPAQARYAQSGKIQAMGGLPGTFILAVKI